MITTIQSIDLPGCTLPAPTLIALVGAGGKTSTAFWLANLLKQQGCRVLVTTTTHMFRPQTDQYDYCYLTPDEQALLTQFDQASTEPAIHYCATGFDSASGKVTGLSPSFIDQLKHSGFFDALIVEADGSRRLPLKAPAEHEPCLPDESDLVIGLCGAEALLKPADPEQIQRWPLFSALTGCQEGEEIGETTLSRLLGSTNGLFKSIPPRAKRIWQINKFDLSPFPDALCQLSQRLMMQHIELHAVWLTDMRSTSPLKHKFQNPIGND